ncbi:MAG: Ig-like domain-containing protein, partial [Acidobacteriota bacterium]
MAVAMDLHRVPAPGAPAARDLALTGLEDVPLPVTLEADDPGQGTGALPLSFQVTTPPSNGALLGTPPNLTYRPDADWNGVDQFTYEASNAHGGDVGTVSVTIDPVPDAPRLDAIANISMTAGSNLAVPITAVDPDGNVITLEVSGLPAFANFAPTGNGVGELTFSPGFGDAGSYGAVRVTATDNVYADEVTFSLEVEPVSGPPVAADLVVEGLEDTSLSFELAAVDPDGDAIAYEITAGPSHGTLAGTPPSLTYIPSEHFFGGDAVTYTASDAGGTSAPATVHFQVAPVPDPPQLAPLGDITMDEGAERRELGRIGHGRDLE